MGNPIALVESENTGRGSSLSEDNFNGLASSMHVCVGAKVVLTKNYSQVGLSNGSTGICLCLYLLACYVTTRIISQAALFTKHVDELRTGDCKQTSEQLATSSRVLRVVAQKYVKIKNESILLVKYKNLIK